MVKKRKLRRRRKQVVPRRGVTLRPTTVGTRSAGDHLPAASHESTAEQAALLGHENLHHAQRQSLAAQIGRAQGNQHVQRVVGVTKTRRGARLYHKSALKPVLAAVLDLQIMNRGSLQLSKDLSALLEAVTSRPAADIALLWKPPPKGSREALKRLDHVLPARVPASTMRLLQNAKMRLMLGARPAPRTRKPPAAGPSTSAAPGQERDPLLKAIAAALQNKPPEAKSDNTEAVKKVLEGYLATGHGKRVKAKVLQLLGGRAGRPFTAMVGTAALAAMVANNTTIPSTPEIPLQDNLTLKFEFEGTFRKPTGIKVTFKFTFGGPAKRERAGKEQTVLALPKELHAYIEGLDKRAFYDWFKERAQHDWDWALPEQEEERMALYVAIRDRPEDLGLPDTRLVAEHTARALVQAAVQNRVRELRGKRYQEKLEIDLGPPSQWNIVSSSKGLDLRLARLLRLLVPKVPYQALGIKEVTFKCGKWTIKSPVQR